jgi:hypothetical protein
MAQEPSDELAVAKVVDACPQKRPTHREAKE